MTNQYTPSDVSAADSGIKQSEAVGIRMGSSLSPRGHVGAAVREIAAEIAGGLIETVQKNLSDENLRAAALLQVGHQLQVAAINTIVQGESVSLGDMIAAHGAVARAQIMLSAVVTAEDTVGLEKMNETQRADMSAGLHSLMDSNFGVSAYSAESKSQCACCDAIETEIDAFFEERKAESTPRITTGEEAAAMAKEVGVDASVPDGAQLGCIEFDEKPSREQVIRAIMQATGATYEQVESQIPQDIAEILHAAEHVSVSVKRAAPGSKTVH